jgi:hypothetical protein
MITPTLYNEARFGYTHYPTRFDILETENMNQKFGVIRTRSSSPNIRPRGPASSTPFRAVIRPTLFGADIFALGIASWHACCATEGPEFAPKAGSFGAAWGLNNRADFYRAERAACKLSKIMKSSVSSRLKPANSGPSVAQQAGQGHCAEGHLAQSVGVSGILGTRGRDGLMPSSIGNWILHRRLM